VTEPKSIQFFIREEQPEQEVVVLLGTLLGFLVESTDVNVPGAIGFAQVTAYSEGYRQGILITWPGDVELQVRADELVRKMALHFHVPVLLEPDDSGAEWILAHPDGQITHTDVIELDDGIDVSGLD